MRTIQKLRNIGIMAHVDAGKTTLTERILYYSGMTHKLGNVDDGNTVMDTDPQESKRGITISSAAITTYWKRQMFGNDESRSYQINIIDTPGHVDFTVEVERSLRVLDGAIALFCAVSGVQPQSETVWRQAEKYGVPRICFVNKMDREGADFIGVLEQLRTRLNAHVIPMQLPIGAGSEFRGIVDIVKMKAIYWDAATLGVSFANKEIPPDMLDLATEYRDLLIEQLAVYDDALMATFLEDPDMIDEHQLLSVLRRATIEGGFVPVYCGAAYKNVGVQPLLDAVVDILPGPQDQEVIEVIQVTDSDNQLLAVNEYKHFSGLVFKVLTDPHVGKIALIRVYTGTLKSGQPLLNVSTGQFAKAGRIVRVHSNKMETIDSAGFGEIVAIAGIKNVKTGDTLTDKDHPVLLEAIDFPEPVIGYAVETKFAQDEQKMAQALATLQSEDPSISVLVDEQTGQTVINGMGELHLEVVLEKLKTQHQLLLNVGAPKIAYREQLGQLLSYRSVIKKQNGGNGQYALIEFEIGPRSDGKTGLEFVNDIKGGAITQEFVAAVEKGFQRAMSNGVLAGYPVEGMFVRLFDGAMHDEDSHGLDFELAALEGFKEAARLSKPRLLEPIMELIVEGPAEYTGAITADISRRRGQIKQIDATHGKQLITADVPLESLFKYIGSLRSLTAGRAAAHISFSHYAVASKEAQQKLLMAS